MNRPPSVSTTVNTDELPACTARRALRRVLALGPVLALLFLALSAASVWASVPAGPTALTTGGASPAPVDSLADGGGARGGGDTASSAHYGPAPWHLAVFGGGTSLAGHTYWTVGAEAEYRLPVWHRRVGIGLLADRTLSDHSHTIVGAMTVVRPVPRWSNLKLMVVPSIEFTDGHRTLLLRSGIGWDLHVEAFSLSPLYSLDFVDGEVAQVFGLTLGLGF